MKLKAIAVAVLCCLGLSGCVPLESNVENLIQPPRLTHLQSQVDNVLRDSVGSGLRLKYPVSGEHRSAFSFLDIDGDQVNEAIAFFTDHDDTIRIAILRQKGDDWIMSDIIPGLGFCTDVDFISVVEMAGSPRLLVGWSGTGLDNNLLAIYSYTSGSGEQLSLQLDSRWDYSRMAVTDLDRNGEQELLMLIAADMYGRNVPSAQVVGMSSEGIIDLLDYTDLYRNISGFHTPVVSQFGGGSYCAVVDCTINTGKLATVVLQYDGTTLQLAAQGADNNEIFRQTLRSQNILSADIDDDGTVEIPVERLAPGYVAGNPEQAYIIDYNTMLSDGTLSVAQSAYVNLVRGYRMLFPSRWQGHPVSVLVQPDNSEVVIFLNTSDDLYDHSSELIRIQVYSTLDGPDKLSQDRYFELATSGTYVYSAALPSYSIDGISITQTEVRQLFSLIK